MILQTNIKSNLNRISICRILLSLLLPILLGIIAYSFLTGMYQEPLYWLSMLFSFHKFLLLMFLPLLVYTLIMEYLGFKLIRNPKTSKVELKNVIIFLIGGTLIGLGYSLIANEKSSLSIHVILAFVCLMVTSIKLRFHIKERKIYSQNF